ncbi:hypothetical protein CH251_05435 [Rhodococcus sp. 06-462-5]|nr:MULTISPECIES: tautomerase family protein [unclassified Rhodococcus (in: high G+C Gram-positive bacteria)]OZC77233.1 hypothetical protein CH251_05435 [Rhodococcus sp. 06-462-5]OZE63390.1 hypothetical protein CH270_18015 [Rhodococcus sp. 02-925g]
MGSDILATYLTQYDRVHWEFHIDETSEELWMIDGLIPPPGRSEAEMAWAEANAPLPY